MKGTLVAVAAATMVFGAVVAHAEGKMGGPGFRTLSGAGNFVPNSDGQSFGVSPAIGVRQWMTEKVGFDVAVGVSTASFEDGSPATKKGEGTGLAFDIGVPYAAKKWDKVSFILEDDRRGRGKQAAQIEMA